MENKIKMLILSTMKRLLDEIIKNFIISNIELTKASDF